MSLRRICSRALRRHLPPRSALRHPRSAKYLDHADADSLAEKLERLFDFRAVDDRLDVNASHLVGRVRNEIPMEGSYGGWAASEDS